MINHICVMTEGWLYGALSRSEKGAVLFISKISFEHLHLPTNAKLLADVCHSSLALYSSISMCGRNSPPCGFRQLWMWTSPHSIPLTPLHWFSPKLLVTTNKLIYLSRLPPWRNFQSSVRQLNSIYGKRHHIR